MPQRWLTSAVNVSFPKLQDFLYEGQCLGCEGALRPVCSRPVCGAEALWPHFWTGCQGCNRGCYLSLGRESLGQTLDPIATLASRPAPPLRWFRLYWHLRQGWVGNSRIWPDRPAQQASGKTELCTQEQSPETQKRLRSCRRLRTPWHQLWVKRQLRTSTSVAGTQQRAFQKVSWPSGWEGRLPPPGTGP